MKFVVNVYGSDVFYESHTDTPAPKEMYNWLSGLLLSKYVNDNIFVNYINIDKYPNLSDFDEHIIEQIDDGELFCPLVAINDEIIQHGNLRIEQVIEWIDSKKSAR